MSAIHVPSPELLLSQQTGDELDFEAAKEVAVAHLFREWLHEIDERLQIVYAKPGAKILAGGYWYIYRKNEGAPPSYWQVTNPDGSPCEPNRSHIEMLQRIDSSRHPRIYQEYRKRQEDARRANEQTAEERHREFREKLDERLKSIYGTQIFLPAGTKDKMDAGGAARPDSVASQLDPDVVIRQRIAAAEREAGLKPTTPPALIIQGGEEDSSSSSAVTGEEG